MNLIKRAYTRRIRPLLDPKVHYKNNPKGYPYFLIFCTNICLSKCFSCAARCDKDYGLPGFMDKPFKMPAGELDLFLDNISGFRPENRIRLSGGEPSMIDPNLLRDYSEIIRQHDRFIDILTNAHGLLDLDPWLFDYIILDEHFNNRDQVKRARRFLKDNNYNAYHVNPMHYHYDIAAAFPNISPGLKCREFMNTISLSKGIVYPCCNMPILEGWNYMDDFKDLSKDLEVYGFSYYNEVLTDLFNDWRLSLPSVVYRACAIGCYRGSNLKAWRLTH